ncbi:MULTISPECIES: MerR family transcriptional regulator [unclassified Solwaraspora]|uniref:MerR family transcriptional regulator n=1 Tax=unclassified Solwaraspora TaxID=2627926 RepID=UPI00259B9EE3|nr:MerR family transcriptional regulator [Solwaraspora sp. WMMA2056]WJK38270.1 MerR family transcriptional regulator [Solwaraspora sp. WMMA2056]
MPPSGLMQIGEVAERTGLSLRTIRYYEEVGIVVPSARSQGGFRLYTEADVARLLVVKRMKPLEFSLEQTRDLLDVLDRLAADEPGLDPEQRQRLIGALRDFHDGVQARAATLESQLRTAREFATELTAHLAALDRPAPLRR